jgi:hypothetical protein
MPTQAKVLLRASRALISFRVSFFSDGDMVERGGEFIAVALGRK